MNYTIAFWVCLGSTLIFFTLWIVTWVVYAYYVSDPAVTTVFEIQPQEYIQDLHDITKHVSTILTRNGVKHCVCAGTALGAARFGHAIEYDDDVDFFVLWCDLKKIRAVLDSEPDVRHKVSKFGVQISVDGKKGYVDLFALSEPNSQNELRYTGHQDSDIDFLYLSEWEDLTTTRTYGGHEGVPQLTDPNPYLTRYYGPNWKTIAVVKPMHGKTKKSVATCMNIVKLVKKGNRV